MSDDIPTGEPPAGDTPAGERIAKVLARSGVCSRRDAEKMIAARRVAVDGVVLESPAFNVVPGMKVTVDGVGLAEPEKARLWRYHKPIGLVTTHKDPQGRPTVFQDLPKDLPRVISVGRLDLNSEGLLLLTNDGELARQLEHPSHGWTRRYRVRLHGLLDEKKFASVAEGVTIDGVTYGPVKIEIERATGSNSWVVVTLTEGKNREIRRVMEHLGYAVNRLIRVSYGPFHLGRLERGQCEEVPTKVLRDNLASFGEAVPEELQKARHGTSGWAKAKPKPKKPGSRHRKPNPVAAPAEDKAKRPARPGARPAGARPTGGKPTGAKPAGPRPAGPRPAGKPGSRGR